MLLCINPFPNKPWYLRVCSTILLKTLCEKEKLLVTSNFSFSHSVFYLSGELSAISIKFKNCRLQTFSVWKSLKLVIWERVKCLCWYCYDGANYSSFYSLPNDKIFDVTKLKAFADDKINIAQMMISVFDWLETIVGKGENAGYQHFLLFPQCFQRAYFLGSLKSGLCGKEPKLNVGHLHYVNILHGGLF